MQTNAGRVAVAVVMGASLIAGCGQKQAARRGPPPLAVDVAAASRHNIATYLTLDGQVAPLQNATLSTQIPGTITGLYATEGDRVRAGQVLAKIDDSTLRAQLAQAQANYAQAQARLSGSSEQIPITQQQTSGGVQTAQEGVVNARNSLASAQAAYDSAKTSYDSNNELFKQGFVAKTALDQSRAAYVSAQQGLNNARLAVSNAETALATAKKQTGQNSIQQSTVASDRANVSASRANIQLLQAQIAQTTVIAPFDGMVTQRMLDPGAIASASQPIFVLSHLSEVYVNANVPDDDLPYVRDGKIVEFTTSSNPGRTYRGRIVSVNAQPTQGTLSYRARIVQPNPDLSLRGGMLVSIIVRKDLHKDAIVVPRSAVFQSEAGAKVFTVAAQAAPAPGAAKAPAGAGAGPGGAAAPPGMVAHEVPVRLGLQTDTEAEVISPQIRPGTQVITTRPDALQDGSVVAIGGPQSGPPGARPGGSKPAH